MQCISPILIRSNPGKSRHYVDTDGVDRFASNTAKALGASGLRRDYVPCGQCNFCLANKRQDWSFRLNQELKKSENAHFLTFTYNDSSLPVTSYHEQPTLCKSHVQLLKKRLRQGNLKYAPWPIRYFTVGEYGTETDRPHYHSIVFNLHSEVVNRLHDYWKFGNSFVGTVTPASIGYVTKYVINRHKDNPGREPPFSLMSRRPGIGSAYLDTHTDWHRDSMRNYTMVNGKVSRLPRFYKDKMFSDVERAALAEESLELAEFAYVDDLKRYSRFYRDPSLYYDDVNNLRHELITSKINLSNQF